MKHKTFVSCFLATMLLTACQQHELVVEPPAILPIAIKSHTIPMDTALSRLNSFMQNFEDKGTRSEIRRTVSSIDAVTLKPQYTRATGIDCDTILYIANFTNNQGYAILAADDRIPEQVLVVTDEGHMSPNTFCASSQTPSIQQPSFPGYPSTGPGFFTHPSTGNELYMNPNTVNLYIDSEGDTLVGNFETDETTRNVRSIYALEPNPGGGMGFPDSLVFNYAVGTIKYPDHRLTQDLTTGENGGGGSQTAVAPLLAQYKEWSQHEPFNALFPLKKPFGKTKSRNAFVGCFPLSIAKVMTARETPKNYVTSKNFVVNWQALKCHAEDQYLPILQNFFYDIAEKCNCWYFYEGTFTFPFMAVYYLQSKGYPNATKKPYNFTAVKNMLDSYRPVIIFSVPNINITKSHCWNIDGYKIYTQNLGATVSTTNMVHCDFGWSGSYNGYYVSGIFKMDSPDNEYDNPYTTSKDLHYNNYLHILTY